MTESCADVSDMEIYSDEDVDEDVDDDEKSIHTYLDKNEYIFLFHEIFVSRVYARYNISYSTNSNRPLVVIDAGANIGLFTLFCDQMSESNIKCITIEPCPLLLPILESNIKYLIESNNAIIIPKAIGSHSDLGISSKFHMNAEFPGETTRHLEERNSRFNELMVQAANCDIKEIQESSSKWKDTDNQEFPEFLIFDCEMTTISKIFQDFKSYLGSTIDILKIDIEGDEELALHGISDDIWDGFDIRQVIIGKLFDVIWDCDSIYNRFYISIEVYNIDDRLCRIIDILKKRNYLMYLDQPVTEVSAIFILFFLSLMINALVL